MKKLMGYITEMFELFTHDILTESTILSFENKLNDYISNNYVKIKNKKYIKLKISTEHSGLIVNISHEFEEELRIHYPERLI